MKWAVALALAGALAAPAAQKTVRGTVTSFRPEALEFGVKTDAGAAVFVKVGPETDVASIAPGERDLKKAKAAKITDVEPGDRVLVSFVDGMVEARRVVVISAVDIARRNEAERADWQRRGLSGIVSSAGGGEIVLEQKSPEGVKKITLAVGAATKVKRYAPDSVRFTEAQPSTIAEIAVGDQVQARGEKSADGLRVAAEDVVFGTFVTRLGKVTAADAEKREIHIEDLGTKEPLTVRITAASQIKKLPDLRTMFAQMMRSGSHGEAPKTATPPAPFDAKKMLQQLPAGEIGDIKEGTSVVITSTRGTKPGEATAIMVLANADALLQMAQTQAGDKASPMEAIGQLHGGMFTGPAGFSLPAILP